MHYHQLDDPHEVFQACLEYKRSSATSLGRSSLLPKSSSLSASFYPSLEGLTKECSKYFHSEKPWENSNISMKKKTPSNSQQSKPASLYPSLEGLANQFPKAFDPEIQWEGSAVSEKKRAASDSPSSPATTQARMPQACTPEACMPRACMPNDKRFAGIADVHDINYRRGSILSNNSVKASSNTNTTASDRESNVDTFAPFASAARMSRGEDFNSYIPREHRTDNDDDELLVQKLAAYNFENNVDGTRHPGSEARASIIATASTGPEAEATILDCGTIHPFERESAVQAELVDQTENARGIYGQDRHHQEQRPSVTNTLCHEATVESQPEDAANLVSVSGQSINEEIPTEATVIESGDPEKATLDNWSEHTTDAVVLQQESEVNPFQSADDSDVKNSYSQDHEETATEYQEQHGNRSSDTIASVNNAAIAACYNINPLEVTNQSVQAEYMGSSESTNIPSSNEADRIENAVEISETEHATEAMVLDSGPSDKATIDAWSPTEEAHVLRENYDEMDESNAKDAEQRVSSCTVSSVASTDLSSNGQAEIRDISEHFHPSEYVSETVATAELVGNNPNEACTREISNSMMHPQSDGVPTRESSSRMVENPSSRIAREAYCGTENQTGETISSTIIREKPCSEIISSNSELMYDSSDQSWKVTAPRHGPNKSQKSMTFSLPAKQQVVSLATVCTPPKIVPNSNDSAFRMALMQGDVDGAIRLHETYEVDLMTPFADIDGEVLYPVHCAVEGGSLPLLKWLVDENQCELWSISTSDDTNNLTPILTSDSRSLLSIALAKNSIDIIRYLVVEKGMRLSDEKDLPVDRLLQTLDSVLAILPAERCDEQS
ncbi:unnamed protein product [Pseudo-nitzschia multistriata]|uniref:Uncharacterized protein n=1 Tax=Pseudo-nitzschia multistriata TaxID=183589 RepID=A0A448ZRC7_9STRA|nr:unnamed protein product [Pseudo-nitzschia multistriata]